MILLFYFILFPLPPVCGLAISTDLVTQILNSSTSFHVSYSSLNSSTLATGLSSSNISCFPNASRILVMEKKTWEEALDYCKMTYTGLACLTSSPQLVLPETVTAQTLNAWIGLRFMNGKWFWVDGQPIESLVSFPLCPVPYHRCGACDTETHICDNRDCGEELNFFCY